MNKALIILLVICNVYYAGAQNYNCLQPGARPYFINGNNYLRSMRIDSITATGGDTIFYPYHTPRGYYFSLLDSTGGSWLGSHVIKQAAGTFLFDNMWLDTIVIKTQSGLGDSWIFYEDATRRSYIATTTAIDTMSISGIVDSIKTITITADSAGMPYPSDPVNNFKIILSKNYGFVQVFDLYTFPYRLQSDTTEILHGNDYYLDLVLNDLECGCDNVGPNMPDTINSVFHLIPFHNPSMKELYNFNAGEIFEFGTYSYDDDFYSTTQSLSVDTILTKILTDSSVIYNVALREGNSSTYSPPPPSLGSSSFSVSYFPSSSESFDTSKLIDESVVPEEWGAPYFFHYFPKANYTTVSPCPDTLCLVDVNYIDYTSGFVIFEGSIDADIAAIGSDTKAYSIGYGISATYYFNWETSVTSHGGYIYISNGSDDSCGRFSPISDAVQQIPPILNNITIFPVPAYDLVNINSTKKMDHIEIINLVGQIAVDIQEVNNDHLQIDISSLQPGFYIIKIDDNEVRKFVKK